MYEDKTPEEIKAAITGALKSGMDTQEGSFADDMAGPLAVELYKLYGSLNAVRPMVWVNESSGTYLDLAAEDIGIEPRKAGTKAAVTLEITGTAGFLVKQGTQFLTADNLYFVTAADADIPESGTAEVPAQAARVGGVYNAPAGEIRFQYQNDSRIKTVSNPQAAQGGTDPETDESLYARIVYARQKPRTSGNVHDYESWALEVDGVGFAKCTPIKYGPGTVGVLIADADRQPVDESVVTACAAHIEACRPVGPTVTVSSAEALIINVAAAVIIDASTTKEAVREAFRRALDEYLRSIAFVQYEVRYNRVSALLMGIDGVIDRTGLTLNGVADSVTVGPEQVPLLGEVTVS